MRIRVVGNCQASQVAQCLRVMIPKAAVQTHEHVTLDDLQSWVEQGDRVFVQGRGQRDVDRMSAERPEQVVRFPYIPFPAFHPDAVYAKRANGTVRSAIGDYNSSIVLYGWLHGLTAAETEGLFCEAVYDRLGFFDFWQPAKQALLREGERAGMPLPQMFESWRASGCFMHTTNHPALVVVADIARELARRACLAAATMHPERYMNDGLLVSSVWPVYPEIGRRLGIDGSYEFKSATASPAKGAILDLNEFISLSFEGYAGFAKDDLVCERLTEPQYAGLERLAHAGPISRIAGPASAPAAPAKAENPYAGLPDHQFWRRAIARTPRHEVDPVIAAPFKINQSTKVATAGSCFAQHISQALARSGYNYYVAEKSLEDLDPSVQKERNFGIFSARYGNIYTARQLLQLFDRAYGRFHPRELVWRRPDGRYVDAFRPEIEPNGFANMSELETSRADHFTAVREMFEKLDVLVFTLGLTEAWRVKHDGAVLPLAPGVVGGSMSPLEYEFVNFSAAETHDDLVAFLARLAEVNRSARVILTVSPVPLIATYERRHVLVSTTYSKSALRVAAEEVARASEQVWYFPSYEIITGSFARGEYFSEDLRSVTTEGVNHVMRLFFSHAACAVVPNATDAVREREAAILAEIVCEEEKLEAEGV